MMTPDDYFDKCKEQEILCQVDNLARAKARMDHAKGKLSNGFPCGSYEHQQYAIEAYKMEQDNE